MRFAPNGTTVAVTAQQIGLVTPDGCCFINSAGGTIVNVSSDAAVEAYAGWGGYGSAKAALDQLTARALRDDGSPEYFPQQVADLVGFLHGALPQGHVFSQILAMPTGPDLLLSVFGLQLQIALNGLASTSEEEVGCFMELMAAVRAA